MAGDFIQRSHGISFHSSCDLIVNTTTASSVTDDIQHRNQLTDCKVMAQSRFPRPNVAPGSESLSPEQLARFRNLNAGVDSTSAHSDQEWNTVQSKSERKQQQKRKTQQNARPPMVSKAAEAVPNADNYSEFHHPRPYSACLLPSPFFTLRAQHHLSRSAYVASSFFAQSSIASIC